MLKMPIVWPKSCILLVRSQIPSGRDKAVTTVMKGLPCLQLLIEQQRLLWRKSRIQLHTFSGIC